ncbi:outer membrane beta-barrel protein [Spirosoma sp. BT702]|uniref:Outer membrane beta-barrel protein n=1 Tax=Spirosoma profusum TaxID=2771354 RepID=A0A926XWJ6_9BACT|nr:outer membrane beta-barrel protein [Spirosoma profusum]MBD2701859.1 outer membrane beta-barrel protein [Spirosoma profusum]
MFKSIITSVLVLGLVLVQHGLFAQKGAIGINAGVTFDEGRTPLAASAEYFISDAFSVGLQGYHSWQTLSNQITVGGQTLGYTSTFRSTFVGLRANFHVNYFLAEDYQQFDPYIGLSVGKIMVNGKEDSNFGFGPSTSQGNRSYDGVTLYLPVGFRYLITNHIGAFVEYNLGLANTTADVDQNKKIDKFYEKRQYRFGLGLSMRF